MGERALQQYDVCHVCEEGPVVLPQSCAVMAPACILHMQATSLVWLPHPAMQHERGQHYMVHGPADYNSDCANRQIVARTPHVRHPPELLRDTFRRQHVPPGRFPIHAGS
jgi:hypothetical protein